MSSFVATVRCRSVATRRARVVLPVAGAPATITSLGGVRLLAAFDRFALRRRATGGHDAAIRRPRRHAGDLPERGRAHAVHLARVVVAHDEGSDGPNDRPKRLGIGDDVPEALRGE